MKHFAAVSLTVLALAACTSTGGEGEETLISANAEDCAAITAEMLGAAEASSQWVEAAEDLPAFCEVTATLSPAKGSNIGVVYRLPAEWNGKLLGLGGGGWAGNVTLMAAEQGLSSGYATLQTDGGNEGTDVWNNQWVAENPEAAADFSHRAVHEMTVAGKQLAASFYGQEHERAYFQGCSTGGRMALMEAQRYPEDYDAISAGAPVYTLQTQTSAVFRNQTFAQGNGAGGFTEADLQLVQQSVLDQCDAADGLEDGIVNDPRACTWQPSSLLCEAGESGNCLNGAQVAALETLYEGERASDGSWTMHPISRGGEASWGFFMAADGSGEDPTGGGGLGNLLPIFFGDENVTLADFDESDYLTVRQSEFADMYEAKDTELSPFFERGGRLLLWHGESDPGPSPVATNEYAEAVLQQNPGASDQFRYFTLPGVGHCAGGPGADQVDYLAALDEWVETGDAPERLIGTKADGSLTRPHCAWPEVARFEGGENADPNDPENWTCAPRT